MSTFKLRSMSNLELFLLAKAILKASTARGGFHDAGSSNRHDPY